MQTKYRAEIDGLRAIAVVAVVFYHAKFFGFTGGFVGVDVFFVISGFLITKVLASELSATGTIGLLEFYSKRFKRLYPSLLVVIFSTLLYWIFFISGDVSDTKSFAKSVRFSIFGLANLFFSKNVGGYFDGASEEMPLLHFWSLAVEEQFYFVWTFFLIMSRRKIFRSLLGIILLSFIASEYLLSQGHAKEAFYHMPARIWELGVGGIIALSYDHIRRKISEWPSSFATLSMLIGLLGILTSVFFYDESTKFPGVSALLPVFCTAILVIFGEQKSFVKTLLSNKFLVRLGILSYGWYLWHWPMLAFLRMHYVGALPPLIWRLVVVILSLVLAHLSLEYIEAPVRHGKFFKTRKPIIIIGWSLTVSIFIGGCSYLIHPLNNIFKKTQSPGLVKLINEKPQIDSDCGTSTVENEDLCSFDQGKNQNILYLWGDSHAFALSPFLKTYSEKNKVTSILRSHMGLVPLLGVPELFISNHKVPYVIGDVNQLIFSSIRSKILNNPTHKISVLLSARWPTYLGKKPISVKDAYTFLEKQNDVRKTEEIFTENLRRTIKALKENGVYKIGILLSLPEFKYHIARCLDIERCRTSESEMIDYRKETLSIFRKIKIEFPDTLIIDPQPFLCMNGTCLQVLDLGQKIPVVYDDDHLSVAAGKYLANKLDPELKSLFE